MNKVLAGSVVLAFAVMATACASSAEKTAVIDPEHPGTTAAANAGALAHESNRQRQAGMDRAMFNNRVESPRSGSNMTTGTVPAQPR